ncbi:hypothetical protein EYF80_004998 [Liparis tanakae]|uniref:Uncharacterized protein n=1 Tax=Liparis tanakae TaxID=230148 RepID=A0A4Z2J5Z1_9TELE|nr:hypothetical protein EYF80_004998 [Liparis tanakae]
MKWRVSRSRVEKSDEHGGRDKWKPPGDVREDRRVEEAELLVSSSPRLPPSDLHGVELGDAVSPTLTVARASRRPALLQADVGSVSPRGVTDRPLSVRQTPPTPSVLRAIKSVHLQSVSAQHAAAAIAPGASRIFSNLQKSTCEIRRKVVAASR